MVRGVYFYKSINLRMGENLKQLLRNIDLNIIVDQITIVPLLLTERLTHAKFKMSNTVLVGLCLLFLRILDMTAK